MCPQFLTLQPLDGTHGFTAELDRHDEASRCIYFGIDPRTLEDVCRTGVRTGRIAVVLSDGA